MPLRLHIASRRHLVVDVADRRRVVDCAHASYIATDVWNIPRMDRRIRKIDPDRRQVLLVPDPGGGFGKGGTGDRQREGEEGRDAQGRYIHGPVVWG
ncbi:MAG: hypothetical protein R3F11_10085 [Verrucomicrobiales bacterium]